MCDGPCSSWVNRLCGAKQNEKEVFLTCSSSLRPNGPQRVLKDSRKVVAVAAAQKGMDAQELRERGLVTGAIRHSHKHVEWMSARQKEIGAFAKVSIA